MCGIAGFFDPRGVLADGVSALTDMASALAHRGPDGAGIQWDEPTRVGLAHRRLAIVDLSATGSQPMASHCGRYVISFNGEIYNFEEIRAELRAADPNIEWRGTSDTEVLVELISRKGIVTALRRANGMFALALFDTHRNELTLARDRFGEKPLYYGWTRGVFVFASELKAIAALRLGALAIDPLATAQFFKFGCIPAPRSIFLGISKLTPGCIGVLGLTKAAKSVVETTFWSAADAVKAAKSAPQIDSTSIVDLLQTGIWRSVALRMHADVPLGAFLSGGIDSSLVVAAMQTQSAKPVRTFSVAFNDAEFNEAESAAAVARHLGTAHTEVLLSPEDALAVVPRLGRLFDEPFADSSQIPTILVSEVARRYVTVALSGDGGDELFGGYNRHVFGPELWRRLALIPRPMRTLMADIAGSVMGNAGRRAIAVRLMSAASRGRHKQLDSKIEKLVRAAHARDFGEFYADLRSIWPDPEAILSAGVPAPHGIPWLTAEAGSLIEAEAMMLADTVSYLPDDILTKVDRASMSVGLEARVPFLDPELFNLAWAVPLNMKISDGVGKRVLRDVLARYVPRPLFERPKAGFAIPLSAWLRGPLRDWADDLLSDEALRTAGILDPAPIRDTWKLHLSGNADRAAQLWTVLMFQAWQREWT